MSLRARIAVTAALAVAVAILLVSVGVFTTTRAALLSTVDRELQATIRDLARAPEPLVGRVLDRAFEGRGRLGPQRGPAGDPFGYAQVVRRTGEVVTESGGEPRLPVDDRVRAVAAGEAPAFFATVDAGGARVRVITQPIPAGAIQLGRSVDDIEASLSALARQLLLGGIAGSLVAALLGDLVARRAVRPVRRLTETAETVARTGDLSHRMEVAGQDELGRLAATFNEMLAALEVARRAQHQLVADASHELRTPLTSLRTNIEVLGSDGAMDEADRRALIGDVVTQLDEFGSLVTALVELARGDEPMVRTTAVALDEVVDEAVARARARHRQVEFVADLAPVVVRGDADRLGRAVTNLLDNAAKYAGDAGPVEVRLRPTVLVVRDHGPGVAAEDLPHLFERFYRAAGARGRPGSGLGLAIVRQVARAHGGDARVDNDPHGGAVFTLSLPPAPTA